LITESGRVIVPIDVADVANSPDVFVINKISLFKPDLGKNRKSQEQGNDQEWYKPWKHKMLFGLEKYSIYTNILK
jgi:hypothetical protein